MLSGKDSERHKKIEYYQQRGLCSDCYKKSIGYTEPELLWHSKKVPGSEEIEIWVSGKSYPIKDKLKKMGYRWSCLDSCPDTDGESTKYWHKTVTPEEYPDAVEGMKALGAQSKPKYFEDFGENV